MSSSQKHWFIVVVVVALLLLGLLSWSLRDQPSGGDGMGDDARPEHVSHRSMKVGLPPMPHDPASPPLAWGHKRPEHEPLLRDGPQITPHEPDDARFIELGALLLWAMPFGLEGDDGRVAAGCAHEYEPLLRGPCQWRTDYVIRRVRDTEVAQLEYLQATPTNDNDDPACLAFASCTASVWARQADIPMPSSLGDVFAFHEFGRGARWRAEKGDRRQFYQDRLDESRAHLEHLESLPRDEREDDPIVRYGLEWQKRSVTEYQNMLAIIEQHQGP